MITSIIVVLLITASISAFFLKRTTTYSLLRCTVLGLTLSVPTILRVGFLGLNFVLKKLEVVCCLLGGISQEDLYANMLSKQLHEMAHLIKGDVSDVSEETKFESEESDGCNLKH